MSINELLRNAVLPIVPICEPETYDGNSEEYCTFNYSEFPDILAEGCPDVIRYEVQLHWFLPKNQNPIKKKVKIRQALLAAGATYPSTIPAGDEAGQHYVFEFQFVDGDV